MTTRKPDQRLKTNKFESLDLSRFLVNVLLILSVIVDTGLKSISRYRGGGILNRGITLGFGSGLGNIFWAFFSTLFIIIIAIILANKRFKLSAAGKLGSKFLLAGGISNLISRLVWGGVVDYWCLRGWTCFNIADIIIDISFVFWCIEILKYIQDNFI